MKIYIVFKHDYVYEESYDEILKIFSKLESALNYAHSMANTLYNFKYETDTDADETIISYMSLTPGDYSQIYVIEYEVDEEVKNLMMKFSKYFQN